MHQTEYKEDFDYIDKNLMPEISRTFHATLQTLPDDLRKDSVLGYALCRAIDTVEDDRKLDNSVRVNLMNGIVSTLERGDVSGAKNLEKRLVVVSTKNEGYQHLMDNYSKVVGASKILRGEVVDLIAECSREMADGLSNQTVQDIRTLDDHHRYCHYAAAVVGYFITKDLVAREYISKDKARELMPFTKDNNPSPGQNPAHDFAVFLQLTNNIRDFHEDYRNNIYRWPADLVHSRKLSFQELVDGENSEHFLKKGALLLNDQIEDARRYLPGAIEWVDGLLNSGTGKDLSGVRTSWGYALALSVATLKQINGPQFFTKPESRKLSKKRVEEIGLKVKEIALNKNKIENLVNELLLEV